MLVKHVGWPSGRRATLPANQDVRQHQDSYENCTHRKHHVTQDRHPPVTPFRTTAIVAACLLAAVCMGMWLGHLIPVDQLSPETKDIVRLTTNLVATMSALLLGLLVNSSKASYDTTRTRVMQKASKYALLDRVLEICGPQAAEVRDDLHALIEAETRRLWPDDAHVTAPTKSQHQMGNAFYLSILRLEARDDIERALKAQAVNLAVDLGQLLSLMDAESTSISKPMLTVVVLWLVQIFLGFSVIAPPTATAIFALIVSALCAAGAIFLILELDEPFGGLIRIPSEPMRNLLRQFGK
jgi:hypothetical protein